MDYLNSVPFGTLDRFYFEEVVGQMPVPLREWATDLAVLRGNQQSQSTDTIRQLYPSHYLFLPWILDDIFEVPEDERLIIGKGYSLLLISVIITDQLVDRHMPNIRLAPLVQQQLMLQAHQIFSSRFNALGTFWDQYYVCLTEAVQSLAVEVDCLDMYKQPYTYEIMCQVCTGKAAVLRLLSFALALVDDCQQRLPIIDVTLNNLVVADQLNDDALDWREDHLSGRCTLPIVLALEAEGESLETARNLSVEALKTRLERHGILIYMAEQAIKALEEACNLLQGAGLARTKWNAFLTERLALMRRQSRYYRTLQLLDGLIRRLHK